MSLIKKMGLGLKKIYQKNLSKLDTLKGNPKSISKGFATGVAISFTPFVGFHLLLSLFITKITNKTTAINPDRIKLIFKPIKS